MKIEEGTVVFAIIFSIFMVTVALAVIAGIIMLVVTYIRGAVFYAKNKDKIFSTTVADTTNKRPIYDTNGNHCGYYDSSNGTYWDTSGLVQTTPLGWRR